MKEAPYAIVDIETTGGHAAGHRITEIAILLHDGKRVVDQLQTLVNPERKIPLHITALTGINNAMVAAAPTFEEVSETIFDWLRGRIFVAHNVNFDYSFIHHHLKLAGFNWQAKKLCTVRLSRKVFPGLPSYSLGNLCRHAGISIHDRHRAGGDATATAQLFAQLLQLGGTQHVALMLKKTSAEQWLPMQLERKVIDALPETPGVYYFHNSKGKVIYVGKAVNIRKRVSSHFSHNDGEVKRQNFLRLVAQVTFNECASELHALVLESTEIRRLWPRYNYSQKQPVQRYGLYMFEDARGYLRLAIDKKKKNLPALYQFNLLHEGLVMLRKLAEEFSLDHKLCHLDKTRITAEDWALIGTVARYNRKVKKALAALDVQLPTFAVVEKGRKEKEQLYMLIERGIFWGMGSIPAGKKISSLSKLKEQIVPYADNDFIRNSLYAYVESFPEKKLVLKLK